MSVWPFSSVQSKQKLKNDPDFQLPASMTSEQDSEDLYGTRPPRKRNMTKLKATSAVLSRTDFISKGGCPSQRLFGGPRVTN